MGGLVQNSIERGKNRLGVGVGVVGCIWIRKFMDRKRLEGMWALRFIEYMCWSR